MVVSPIPQGGGVVTGVLMLCPLRVDLEGSQTPSALGLTQFTLPSQLFYAKPSTAPSALVCLSES